MGAPGDDARGLRLLLASSNPGKLREYRELATGSPLELDWIPNFQGIPPFDESAGTFAENVAGKALRYSRFRTEIVLADDSGLVVPALGGAPGVRSARYAGSSATESENVRKLLREMEGRRGDDRRARFVCVIAVAQQGRAIAVVSDFVEGLIAENPSGSGGFGYDPIFVLPELGCTFADTSPEQKNHFSHRGKAFRKLCQVLGGSVV